LLTDNSTITLRTVNLKIKDPEMSSSSLIVTCNAQTPASMEKVWGIIADVKNWNQWDSEISRVELRKEELVDDAEGELTAVKGSKSHFRVSRVTPDFTYTLETRLPFAQVYTRRILGYHNYKTIITHEVWIEGPLRDFWGALLGKRYARRMEAMNARLVELAAEPVSRLS